MPKIKDLIIGDTKRCCVCKCYKPLASFYKDIRSSTGLRGECKECRKDREKGYYYKDKNMTRKRIRKYLYGITPEDFDTMWEKQHRRCAICNKELQQSYGKLHDTCHVDHNHKTGKVRALLCLQCNSLCGMARDNSAILIKAAKYLEDHDNAK